MKKNILFLDLAYHMKTKSSIFLLDLLKTRYDVDLYYYDTALFVINDMHRVLDREYDFLVCWQVMPDNIVLSQLHFKKGIFFPMYDNVVGISGEEWDRFSNFTIISFSHILYECLLKRGFNVKYIQYFPKIKNIEFWGNPDSLFLWQRVNAIGTDQVSQFYSDLKINKIYVHRAMDPGQYCKNKVAEESFNCSIKYSTWFDDKRDLENLIMQCAYYMAPRMYEGIGMSYLEAMAMGRCVIAPDYSTMNEYIKDGETGILYDYQKPDMTFQYDLRKIQKNTYEYMSEGYLKWETEKYYILDWMEEKTYLTEKDSGILENAIKHDNEKKFKMYFALLDRWLMMRNKGIYINRYFLKRDIHKIAIYGGGKICRRLIEELEKSSIEVVCVIDKNADKISLPLPVIKLTQKFPKVDVIVVTPIYSYDTIYKKLREKTDYKIVSISEVISNLTY